MIKDFYILWSDEISSIRKFKRLSIPLNIFLKEASELSGFTEKHWQKTDELPGMSEASPVIEAEISAEIDALVAEISRIVTDTAKLTEASRQETGISLRAREWIREMHHLLKWAYRYPPDGSGLSLNVPAFIREYRRKSKDASALAQRINTLQVMVRTRPDELGSLPGLTPEFLAEGEALQAALYNVRKGRTRGSDSLQAAVRQKNALVHILLDRVSRVRTAARFVYRNHPQIRKLAMSDFERRRRSKNRRASNITQPER
jgi:hypothetical protein